jgi:endonuclease I
VIREESSSKSTILERVIKGQNLRLLSQGNQTNGYFHVQTTDQQEEGYIYRTFVRRFNESFPESEPILINRTIARTAIDWTSTIPNTYYLGTDNLYGPALKSKLHSIIKNHKEYPYSSETTDVYDILKVTDQDPNNPKNVVDVYSLISIEAAQEYNSGAGWEREHVWSQSHGQFGRLNGPGSDVHHLRPILRQFNGSSGKSNKDFDEGGAPFMFENDYSGCYVTDSTWAPNRKVRGDVARMMFYMAVRYEGDDGYPDLELVESSNTQKNYKNLPFYGRLSTLILWHDQDPVDNWERKRNDIIFYQFQHNRNPFIDHPEFVHRIWGN